MPKLLAVVALYRRVGVAEVPLAFVRLQFVVRVTFGLVFVLAGCYLLFGELGGLDVRLVEVAVRFLVFGLVFLLAEVLVAADEGDALAIFGGLREAY